MRSVEECDILYGSKQQIRRQDAKWIYLYAMTIKRLPLR